MKPPSRSRATRCTSADLGGVAGAAEHALAEEGGAEHHAIEAADLALALPDLDRMGMALAMEGDEEQFDLGVDPGVLAARGGGGAAGDGAGEIGIGGDPVRAGEDGAQQPLRQVEAASSGMTPRRSGSSQ